MLSYSYLAKALLKGSIMSTYAICERYWNNTEKKLNRVANKCKRLGNPFVFDVVGEEYRTDTNRWGEKVAHKFILVNVEGTAKVNDWEFVATLGVQPAGNIIRRYNKEIDIPKRFWDSPNVCEHCNTVRPRVNLYIIHNVVTDEFKQVGGTCLKLYTNGLSLEYIAAWIDGLTELDKMDGVAPQNDCASVVYYDVRTVIHYAAAITKKIGYLSTSDPMPTRNAVSDLLATNMTISEKLDFVNKHRLPSGELTISDIAVSDEEIDAIVRYYNNLETTTEFVHNVQSVLATGYTNTRNIGVLCYLPKGYYDHIAREKEKGARAIEKHEYFGEVGKRYKNVVVKNVRGAGCYSSCYGTTYVYNITIENDVVITWKSSVVLDLSKDYSKIDFTVKAHNEYKDMPQTLVTRCKLA